FDLSGDTMERVLHAENGIRRCLEDPNDHEIHALSYSISAGRRLRRPLADSVAAIKRRMVGQRSVQLRLVRAVFRDRAFLAEMGRSAEDTRSQRTENRGQKGKRARDRSRDRRAFTAFSGSAF